MGRGRHAMLRRAAGTQCPISRTPRFCATLRRTLALLERVRPATTVTAARRALRRPWLAPNSPRPRELSRVRTSPDLPTGSEKVARAIVSVFGRAPRRRTLVVNASLPLQRPRPLHRSLSVSRPRLSTAMLRLTRANRQEAPAELNASTPVAGDPPFASAGGESAG